MVNSVLNKLNDSESAFLSKVKHYFVAPSIISSVKSLKFDEAEMDDLLSFDSGSRCSEENLFNLHSENRLKLETVPGQRTSDKPKPKNQTKTTNKSTFSNIPRKTSTAVKTESKNYGYNGKSPQYLETTGQRIFNTLPSNPRNNSKSPFTLKGPTTPIKNTRSQVRSQSKICTLDTLNKFPSTSQISRVSNMTAQKLKTCHSEPQQKSVFLRREQAKSQANLNESSKPPLIRSKSKPNLTKPSAAATNENTESNATVTAIVHKIQSTDWEVCMKGLQDLQLHAHHIDWNVHEKAMITINRKMIDWIKSPRSSLSKLACHCAGDYLQAAKCSKRPEFDEIIDNLLLKCGDSTKFMQIESNASLDKILMAINPGDAVRVICAHAVGNKNNLVRATVSRLLLKLCEKHKADEFVGVHSSCKTRKYILSTLVKFLMDKSYDVRKCAEKTCAILKKHALFEDNFFREAPTNSRPQLKKILSAIR